MANNTTIASVIIRELAKLATKIRSTTPLGVSINSAWVPSHYASPRKPSKQSIVPPGTATPSYHASRADAIWTVYFDQCPVLFH